MVTVVPSKKSNKDLHKNESACFGDIVESVLEQHATPEVDHFIHSVMDEVDEQYIPKPFYHPSLDELVPSTNRISDINIKYKFLSEIGDGASCRVMEAVNLSNGDKYAVKEMSVFSKGNLSSFRNEVTLLEALDHPNIIALHDCYVDALHFCIATELCSGGSLLQLVLARKSLDEREAAGYVGDILSAVHYLHSNSIAHRDVKLKNILLNQSGPEAVIKLIDFGDSTTVDDNGLYTDFLGTIHYISPEIVRPRKGWEVKKSDMWAVGVIVFILVCGGPPFGGKSQQAILEKVTSPDKQVAIPRKMSSSCRSLIRQLLCDDTALRFSAEEALKHEWLHATPLMSNPPSNSTISGASSPSAVRSNSVEALDFDSSSSEDGHMMELHTTLDTTQSDDIGLVDFAGFDELPVNAIMDEVGHILDHCIASEDADHRLAAGMKDSKI